MCWNFGSTELSSPGLIAVRNVKSVYCISKYRLAVFFIEIVAYGPPYAE